MSPFSTILKRRNFGTSLSIIVNRTNVSQTSLSDILVVGTIQHVFWSFFAELYQKALSLRKFNCLQNWTLVPYLVRAANHPGTYWGCWRFWQPKLRRCDGSILPGLHTNPIFVNYFKTVHFFGVCILSDLKNVSYSYKDTRNSQKKR